MSHSGYAQHTMNKFLFFSVCATILTAGLAEICTLWVHAHSIDKNYQPTLKLCGALTPLHVIGLLDVVLWCVYMKYVFNRCEVLSVSTASLRLDRSVPQKWRIQGWTQSLASSSSSFKKMEEIQIHLQWITLFCTLCTHHIVPEVGLC